MGRKMRICYVINAFAVGGAEVVVYNLARNLDPARFDVTVLAVLDPEGDKDTPMRRRFQDAGVETASVTVGSFRNPLDLLRLVLFFRKRSFDVVHAHNRPSDGWAVRIAGWANVPHRMWTRHSVYSDMTPRQIDRYRNLSVSASAVLAVSESVRQNCISYEGISPDRVVTLDNGINTDLFRPLASDRRLEIRKNLGVAEDQQLLLFVGRLSDHKAPEAFIELIAMLRQRGRNLVGRMCGTGPLKDVVARLVDKDSESVEMLGLRDDVHEILGCADLFVSTSRVEGLPLNVLEAMSTGLPVVAPDIPQVTSLWTDLRYLPRGIYPPPPNGAVPASLVEVWADRVEEVLDDAELMAAMAAEGRDRVKDSYSLARMVGSHEMIYEGFARNDRR